MIAGVEGNSYESLLAVHFSPYGPGSPIYGGLGLTPWQDTRQQCSHCHQHVSVHCTNELCGTCCRIYGNSLLPFLSPFLSLFSPYSHLFSPYSHLFSPYSHLFSPCSLTCSLPVLTFSLTYSLTCSHSTSRLSYLNCYSIVSHLLLF